MSYGENCPTCGEPGISRERRPNGNTFCKNEHSWRSGHGVPSEKCDSPNCHCKTSNTQTIKKILDNCIDEAEIRFIRGDKSTDKHSECIIIDWSVKGKGFGELTFLKQDGQWKIDSECMNKKFVKKILGLLVDSLPLVDEE